MGVDMSGTESIDIVIGRCADAKELLAYALDIRVCSCVDESCRTGAGVCALFVASAACNVAIVL
jgi:hypothetical protein